MSVLVTGAGGFIGGRVVEALHRAGAPRIRAATASLGNPHLSAHRSPVSAVEVTPYDLFDPASLARALGGVEAVIHCARDDDPNRMAEGARRLLEASRAAGVRRFVQLSSVAVYGGASGDVAEDTPPAGKLDAYARAKLKAEADGRAAAGEGMAVVVLRPALVYGPGSALWTTPFVHRLVAGWPGLGAGGMGRANLVHVDDVARSAAFVAGQETGAYAVFNVSGAEAPTWNDYLARFADALGVLRPKGVQSTSLALAAMRRPAAALKRRLSKGKAPVSLAPTYQELQLFRLDAVYRTDKLAAAGLAPSVGLDEGLADCARWAREQGMV